MNEYENIKNIFKKFTVDEEVIPVEFIKYKGKSKTYVTYTFIDDVPSLFAEDQEIDSVIYIDIDIFSDRNYLKIVKKIKELMKENNFIRISSSPDMYEEDTGLYHKTLEFAKERMEE